ncbi:MAG: hypothetical protein AAF151_19080 [Cyanobacteria bacterium J06656_5]
MLPTTMADSSVWSDCGRHRPDLKLIQPRGDHNTNRKRELTAPAHKVSLTPHTSRLIFI